MFTFVEQIHKQLDNRMIRKFAQGQKLSNRVVLFHFPTQINFVSQGIRLESQALFLMLTPLLLDLLYLINTNTNSPNIKYYFWECS